MDRYNLNSRRHSHLGAVVLCGLLGLGCSAVAQTDPRDKQSDPPGLSGLRVNGSDYRMRMVQNAGISLEDAVRIATRGRPGRVVRAVTVIDRGRQIHEIRILLDEGPRVVTVRIDAQTGEIR